jgi:hypothetical protein
MQTWIKFILWIVKLATWKELILWILQRPQSEERNELNQLTGFQQVNEHEPEPEEKAIAVDASCSTSKSLDAHEIEMEALLSAISTNQRMQFIFYDNSFKLSTMGPEYYGDDYGNERYTQIYEKNGSLNHDEYMQLMRAVASSTIIEIELHFFNLEKEDGGVKGGVEMIEQFHEAIHYNQILEILHVSVHDVSIDWVVTTFCDLLLEGDKLRKFVCGGKGSQLSLSTVEKLAAGLQRTKTLTNFVIYAIDPPGWIDTSGLKILLDPFMDGEGSNQSELLLCYITILLFLICPFVEAILGQKEPPTLQMPFAQILNFGNSL